TAEDNYIKVTPDYGDSSTSYVCYLFKDYDSLLEAAPTIINNTFTDWYLNNNKLKQKIEKYKGNIDYHTLSNTKIEDKSDSSTSYNYALFQDSHSTLSKGDSSINIDGTYFIISDYNSQTSTVLYKS
nr:hypothetical protein [Treponema sp.]